MCAEALWWRCHRSLFRLLKRMALRQFTYLCETKQVLLSLGGAHCCGNLLRRIVCGNEGLEWKEAGVTLKLYCLRARLSSALSFAACAGWRGKGLGSPGASSSSHFPSLVLITLSQSPSGEDRSLCYFGDVFFVVNSPGFINTTGISCSDQDH